ncbi:MAG TPA: hypothetical protein VNN79_20865, partial [Actinomycetota bacterium]|nr:hypothetical protein [Actinomycetota bacterium]
KWSNIFLIAWGSAFLIATLVFAVWAAVDPDVSWAIAAITGGVGLIQLVSAFYTQPMKDLQRNLMNLTTYRLVLESHSLKMALARFHLTTPRTLREVRTSGQAGEAKFQVEVLEREIDAVEKVGSADYEALERLHLGEEPDASRNGKKSAADGTPNGRPAEAEAEAPTVAGADKPG